MDRREATAPLSRGREKGVPRRTRPLRHPATRRFLRKSDPNGGADADDPAADMQILAGHIDQFSKFVASSASNAVTVSLTGLNIRWTLYESKRIKHFGHIEKTSVLFIGLSKSIIDFLQCDEHLRHITFFHSLTHPLRSPTSARTEKRDQGSCRSKRQLCCDKRSIWPFQTTL